LSLFDESGRFNPVLDSNIIRPVEADNVIVAIGQRPDASCLAGSDICAPRTEEPDPLTLATSDEKVFVAGDFVNGPTSVVRAMASGKVAAESAHRYLVGEHLSYGRSYAGPVELEFEIDTSKASDLGRVKPAPTRCKGKGDFREVFRSIGAKQARNEASRCYSCGSPFVRYRTCWFCLPCEVECPEDALWVEIPYLLR